MATIEVKIGINATVDKVWDVISDIDNEPKFWKGTKEVKNISKEGDKVFRELQSHLEIKNVCKKLHYILKSKLRPNSQKGLSVEKKLSK